MTGAVLLGLDVGTTSCKAAVVDEAGAEVAHGRARMPWRMVPTGAEIDPEALLGAVLEAASEALAAAGSGVRVEGVGVASLAETGVLLDAGGTPVVPAIAWHDSRGEAEAASLARELPAFSSVTGLSPRPLCGLVKYRWLREQMGADAARGVRWLSVAEWVVHRLGGDQVAELSLASRTGWLDVEARAWWDEALAWAGAPAGLLPEPAVAGTPAGAAGDLLGPAARGAVLAVGGHDHLSAAVGAGATGEGDVLDSWGTAEAFVRAVAPVPRARVADAVADGINVGWHAVEGRQCLLGAMRSGAALQRVLDLLGGDRAALERAALTADAGGMELRGLNDDRNELAGIGAGVTPGAVWRAALESTAEAAADILARMDRVAGPRARLVMAGGWAEGEAARAVREARLGPVARTEAVYMGARGAALTAGRAAARR
jgi:sugar (pentulose or hexulose) kinase